MTSKKKIAKKGSTDFPALRDFFSGYLHQDFRDEYGSAAGAAEAFRQDASESDLRAILQEWKKWRKSLEHASLDEIATATGSLGAAWQPQSLADLDRIAQSLSQ